jgi:YD repeat-containing protein
MDWVYRRRNVPSRGRLTGHVTGSNEFRYGYDAEHADIEHADIEHAR